MLGTPIINLLDLIEGGEEEALNNILVEFSCPYKRCGELSQGKGGCFFKAENSRRISCL